MEKVLFFFLIVVWFEPQFLFSLLYSLNLLPLKCVTSVVFFFPKKKYSEISFSSFYRPINSFNKPHVGCGLLQQCDEKG